MVSVKMLVLSVGLLAYAFLFGNTSARPAGSHQHHVHTHVHKIGGGGGSSEGGTHVHKIGGSSEGGTHVHTHKIGGGGTHVHKISGGSGSSEGGTHVHKLSGGSKLSDLGGGGLPDLGGKLSDLSKGDLPDLSKADLPDLSNLPDLSKADLPDLSNLPDLSKADLPDLSKADLPDLSNLPDLSKGDLPDLGGSGGSDGGEHVHKINGGGNVHTHKYKIGGDGGDGDVHTHKYKIGGDGGDGGGDGGAPDGAPKDGIKVPKIFQGLDASVIEKLKTHQYGHFGVDSTIPEGCEDEYYFNDGVLKHFFRGTRDVGNAFLSGVNDIIQGILPQIGPVDAVLDGTKAGLKDVLCGAEDAISHFGDDFDSATHIAKNGLIDAFKFEGPGILAIPEGIVGIGGEAVKAAGTGVVDVARGVGKGIGSFIAAL